ncbi:helix-turn-helix domain-containing protein [Eubacteriaceae bacterium ES2]|nr:helix-turn-helix domain-containing protein [Eubacteriaceae bacterium ES2]
MRVKMSMLYDGLKSCVLCKKGSSYNKSVPVDDVCFSKKSKVPNDVRYLFIDWSDYDQSAYVNIPSEMLILASRSESIENEHFPPCALIVYAATSLSLLFEMCRDVMRDYFEWGDSLLSLMMNNADLNQLTSHAHSLLANPIMILDNSMKLLSHTPDDPMDDQVWAMTVEKGYADLDHHASQILKRALNLLNDHDSAFNHPMHGNSIASATSVMINDHRVAIVSLMEKNHPISEGDFDCLCYFGKLLSLYFKTFDFHNHLTDNQIEMVLLDILDERFKSDHELTTRLRNVNWQPQKNFFIMVIQSKLAFLNPAQLKKISESLIKIIDHSYAVIYDNNIVLLINHNHSDCLNFQTRRNLLHFLKTDQLCAGLSDAEDHITEIARLYRQSLMALEMGGHLKLTDNLFSFNDHRFNSMIHSFVKLGDVKSYLHPAIRKLDAYDRKKGSALLPTLIAYLKNNGKQLKAANELYIQRGTLLYRIKKIEEMCQIDLSDPQTIFDLQLSLQIDHFSNQLIE